MAEARKLLAFLAEQARQPTFWLGMASAFFTLALALINLILARILVWIVWR